MDCRDCAHHVRTHYKGTPNSEIYDECEWYWKVLHEDEMLEGCRNYVKGTKEE